MIKAKPRQFPTRQRLAGRERVTLIVGLKSADCVVVGAEQEESAGYISKRTVSKLKLMEGRNWAAVIGGAGEAALAEKAMQEMERMLDGRDSINEEVLLAASDEILDSLYTKYVDKDADSQGLSLVIGASCGDDLRLISTSKRVPQSQDAMACVGAGQDIAIYFIDRLHETDSDWTHSVKVAGLALQQAIESTQFCGGESEIYVLQKPPNPRWRSLGNEDSPTEFYNAFQRFRISRNLGKLLDSFKIVPERFIGYSDELHPDPVTSDQLAPVIPMEFFPASWSGSPAYQQHIDEICTRNRDKLLQLGLLNNQVSPSSAPGGAETQVCETPPPPQETKE